MAFVRLAFVRPGKMSIRPNGIRPFGMKPLKNLFTLIGIRWFIFLKNIFRLHEKLVARNLNSFLLDIDHRFVSSCYMHHYNVPTCTAFNSRIYFIFDWDFNRSNFIQRRISLVTIYSIITFSVEKQARRNSIALCWKRMVSIQSLIVMHIK